MIRYNISKRGGPGTEAATGAPVTVDRRRAPLSARPDGRVGFGAVSVLLHAVAIGVLVTVVSLPSALAPPEQAEIELVFEQPAEAPPVVQDEPPPPPEPPAPEVQPPRPPEPPPPEVQPPPEPEPLPPPPPPPPEPPAAPRPPRPRPTPPRPVARQPMEQRPEAQTATAPPTPAPAAQAAAVIDPGWRASVMGSLAARKTYPEEARRRGEEGRVAVRFTVDRSGRVTQAAIVSPSGSALLDEAALGLLRQAVLPAFPPAMTQPGITITTTMRYSLR